MTADHQLVRIVHLTAELSRAARRGEPERSLGDLAHAHDVSVAQIAADIRTLTHLGEHAEAEWLLSLSVTQQQDRVSLSSAGPFRRPLRLTFDEWLAIQAALATDPDGPNLVRRFGEVLGPKPGRDPQTPEPRETPLDQARAAVAAGRSLRLGYVAEGAAELEWWEVQPHQVAEMRGRVYLVCWCPETTDWRHFRLDRVVQLESSDHRFERREDFRAIETVDDVFRPGTVDEVEVRFSPQVARWVRERYPTAQVTPDGGATVMLPATSEAWLVRRVLEYGAHAEVIGPRRYREAVRRAVA